MNNINENAKSSASQNVLIFNYLKNGNRLTSLEALNQFGCFRLASRISDLRKMYPDEDIKVDRIRTNNGKYVAQYYII